MMKPSRNLALLTSAGIIASPALSIAQATVESGIVENDKKCIEEHHSHPPKMPGSNDYSIFVKKQPETKGPVNDCGPEYSAVIPNVTAKITYHNGDMEVVDLRTEQRDSHNRDTGIPLWGGKRAMPLARNGVKSVEFDFPGKQVYDGKNGVLLYGQTVAADSSRVDLDDKLRDWTLSSDEIQGLSALVGKGQPVTFTWVAQDMAGASVEGDMSFGVYKHKPRQKRKHGHKKPKKEEPVEDFDGNRWLFKAGANFGNIDNDQVNLDGGYVMLGKSGDNFFGGLRAEYVESEHQTNDSRQRAMGDGVVLYKNDRTVEKFKALNVGAELGVHIGRVSPYIMGAVPISGDDIQEFWQSHRATIDGNEIAGSNRTHLDSSTGQEPGYQVGAGVMIDLGNGIKLDMNGKKYENGQRYFGLGLGGEF